jgi:hypothetical protein
MWPFSKRNDPELKVTPTSRRLDDLEDAVEHLDRRFKRLQQQVTRWAQDFDNQGPEDEDEDEKQIDWTKIREARNG